MNSMPTYTAQLIRLGKPINSKEFDAISLEQAEKEANDGIDIFKGVYIRDHQEWNNQIGLWVEVKEKPEPQQNIALKYE